MIKNIIAKVAPATLFKLKLAAALVGALLIGWLLYVAVIQPRLELANTKSDLTVATSALKQAEANLAAKDVEIQAKAFEEAGRAFAAAAHAKAVDEAAAKAQVREVQTVQIRERIVERAAKGDGLVSDSMDAFLDDLGGVK